MLVVDELLEEWKSDGVAKGSFRIAEIPFAAVHANVDILSPEKN